MKCLRWVAGAAKDSNILSSSSIALGAVPAAKVRVAMSEARRTPLLVCVVVGGLARATVGGPVVQVCVCVCVCV